MTRVFAFIWTLTASPEAFDDATPDLLAWLGGLHAEGRLAGCGAWASGDGGLTLIRAASREEAAELYAPCPLRALGSTQLVEWEVFFADLVEEGGSRSLRA